MCKLLTCFVLQVPHVPRGFADSVQSCAWEKAVKLKMTVKISVFILIGNCRMYYVIIILTGSKWLVNFVLEPLIKSDILNSKKHD